MAMSTTPSDRRSLVESRKAPNGVTCSEKRATAPSSMSQTPASRSTTAAQMKCPLRMSGTVATFSTRPPTVSPLGVTRPPFARRPASGTTAWRTPAV